MEKHGRSSPRDHNRREKEKKWGAAEVSRRRRDDRSTVPVRDAEAASDVIEQTKAEVPVETGDAVPVQPDAKDPTAERRFDVRREIKPNKLNGKRCVETFLTQFGICADHNHWDEQEKASQLKCCLVDEAGS